MNENTPRVIDNWKVAVLLSVGQGIGWSTQNKDGTLLFHPKIVAMVQANRRDEITEEWCRINLHSENIDCRGAHKLMIYWLRVGTLFTINCVDGDEQLVISDTDYIRA